jgi:hypothetical protein
MFITGETLPYANGVLPAEVCLVFILAGIEALRLFFGKEILCTIWQCHVKPIKISHYSILLLIIAVN